MSPAKVNFLQASLKSFQSQRLELRKSIVFRQALTYPSYTAMKRAFSSSSAAWLGEASRKAGGFHRSKKRMSDSTRQSLPCRSRPWKSCRPGRWQPNLARAAQKSCLRSILVFNLSRAWNAARAPPNVFETNAWKRARRIPLRLSKSSIESKAVSSFPNPCHNNLASFRNPISEQALQKCALGKTMESLGLSATRHARMKDPYVRFRKSLNVFSTALAASWLKVLGFFKLIARCFASSLRC
mmetsp:Transcript_31720/g.91084  ORF Transcript_31720/g.91084 Transcript_31720/m.91084 type:complete len:241 (-) Transcript_31720:702-1424(-)